MTPIKKYIPWILTGLGMLVIYLAFQLQWHSAAQKFMLLLGVILYGVGMFWLGIRLYRSSEVPELSDFPPRARKWVVVETFGVEHNKFTTIVNIIYAPTEEAAQDTYMRDNERAYLMHNRINRRPQCHPLSD